MYEDEEPHRQLICQCECCGYEAFDKEQIFEFGGKFYCARCYEIIIKQEDFING